MSFDEVGKGFVAQYYQCFGSNREMVAGIYRPQTLMTWSGEQLQGVDAIMNKFSELTLGQAQFRADDIDCHPSSTNGVIVVVNGEVLLENEEHPLRFNDVFHLALEEGTNQWYVTNQIFRILGGGGTA